MPRPNFEGTLAKPSIWRRVPFFYWGRRVMNYRRRLPALEDRPGEPETTGRDHYPEQRIDSPVNDVSFRFFIHGPLLTPNWRPAYQPGEVHGKPRGDDPTIGRAKFGPAMFLWKTPRHPASTIIKSDKLRPVGASHTSVPDCIRHKLGLAEYRPRSWSPMGGVFLLAPIG
jgi:hypothetical protein